MSRNYSQSGVYHILFRGVNQQNIFEEKADYDEIKKTILKVKEERNKILCELKQEFPVRQLQRITGVSRGIISRI